MTTNAGKKSSLEFMVFYMLVTLLLLIPLTGGLVGAFGGMEGIVSLFGGEGMIAAPPALRNNFRAICFMFSMVVPLVVWSLMDMRGRAGAFRIVLICAFLSGFARLTGYWVDGKPGLISVTFMMLEFAFMPVLILWHARLIRHLDTQA
jgi:hypothetical protein